MKNVEINQQKTDTTATIFNRAEKLIYELKNNKGSDAVENEVLSVTTKSTQLFQRDFAIDKDTTELFRAMCILSQCSIEGTMQPSSHRPIIGPVIVFFKKLIWKLVEPRFKFVFVGVQDCFSHLISSHAKLLEEVKMLKAEQKKDSSSSIQ